MLKQIFLLISLVLLAACGPRANQPGVAGGPDKFLSKMNEGAELVKINGMIIREGYIDLLSEINPRVKSQLENPMMKQKLIDSLVEQELMYAESVKRGLDQKENILQKAAIFKRLTIAQAVLDDELDRETKKYYEEKKVDQFEKKKIAHIQIDFRAADDKKNKDKAPVSDEEKKAARQKIDAALARLKAGEDFAKVSEEISDDKSTRKKGGDLGYISRNESRLARRNLEALGTAAFTLNKDQLSEVIETKRGYHVVKVLSDIETTPLAEADRLIRFQIQKDIKDKLLGELKKSADIAYAQKPAEPGAPQNLPTEATPPSPPGMGDAAPPSVAPPAVVEPPLTAPAVHDHGAHE